MLGRPNPRVTPETLQGFAAYAGAEYSAARLEELMPSLRSMMADIQALWAVDVSRVEMALQLPLEEHEG